ILADHRGAADRHLRRRTGAGPPPIQPLRTVDAALGLGSALGADFAPGRTGAASDRERRTEPRLPCARLLRAIAEAGCPLERSGACPGIAGAGLVGPAAAPGRIPTRPVPGCCVRPDSG